MKNILKLCCRPSFNRWIPFIKATRSVSNYSVDSTLINKQRLNLIKDLQIGKDFVKISWDKTDCENIFPKKLLRDICKCEKCFQPTSNQRTFTLGNLNNEEFNIKSITFDNTTMKMYIDWESTLSNSVHNGVVLYKQLKSIYADRACLGSNILVEKRKLWLDSGTPIPTVNFNDILKDDESFLKWIIYLIEYGMCIIKNTPNTMDSIYKLAEKVGFFKKTNYGETFKVESKNDPSNLAYTTGYIPPHIDLPYWDYVPQIQILHCLIQSKQGGESTLVDGIACAYKLREIDQKAFETLCTVECLYENIGSDAYGKYHLQKSTPLIIRNSTCSKNGDQVVTSIREGNFQRSHFIGSSDEIKSAYDAYYKFYELLSNHKNRIKFTMDPGDILCFDNCRVLHGREVFESNQKRLLHGGYFDWDQLLSKARVIKASILN